MAKSLDDVFEEIAKLRADVAILTTLVCDVDMDNFEQRERRRKRNGSTGLTPRSSLIIEHIAN